jgi:hypothetical protein
MRIGPMRWPASKARRKMRMDTSKNFPVAAACTAVTDPAMLTVTLAVGALTRSPTGPRP